MAAEAVLTRTTVVSEHTWTVTEVERMPSGYRYEILEGVLYVAAMPLWPHPGIVSELHRILANWVRERRIGRVLPPQSGIYLTETNYVDPDVMYLTPEQVPRVGERPWTAAMAAEVLSKSDKRAPRADREALFRRAGVQEVWYVDFESSTLELRRLTAEGYETTAVFHEGDAVTSPTFPGLEFALSGLWEGVWGNASDDDTT